MRGLRLIALAAALVGMAVVAPATARTPSPGCAHWGRPALALAPRPGAVRVFAIQLRQDPAAMTNAASYARAIDCALAREVLPHLSRGEPNLVVFDEDTGLEALATGSRGAAARALLGTGVAACRGQAFPCATLATLAALDRAYAR